MTNQTPLNLVLECIKAHNDHDPVSQGSYFDEESPWFLDDGTVMRENLKDFPAWYQENFLKNSPNLHIEVKGFLECGDVVILKEYVTGQVSPSGKEVPPYHCFSTYRIKDNEIIRKRVYPVTE